MPYSKGLTTFFVPLLGSDMGTHFVHVKRFRLLQDVFKLFFAVVAGLSEQ